MINLVLAYDAESGNLLWRVPQEGRIVSSLHFSNILFAGDKLFTNTEENGCCHWEIKAYRAQVPAKTAAPSSPSMR
jgi:hypothetical protein